VIVDVVEGRKGLEAQGLAWSRSGADEEASFEWLIDVKVVGVRGRMFK